MGKTIREQIEEERRQLAATQLKIVTLEQSVIGKENTIGTWDCPTSPVGLCVYNRFEDQALDNCLFCHEPDERK